MDDLLSAITRIVSQRIPFEIAEGTVNSINGLTATFTMIGTSGNQSALLVQGAPIAPGNRCIAIRPRTSQYWIILASFGTRKTGYVQNVPTDETTQLFPPQNFGVITTLPGFLIYHWDSPPQKAVAFEIQSSTDGIDEHGLTTFTTRGGYYIISSTVTTYIRVRSIDSTFKASIWTAWLQATPDPPIYQIIQDDGISLIPRTVINFIAGDNVTILAEDNEDENRTDVTISATGGGGSDFIAIKRAYLFGS